MAIRFTAPKTRRLALSDDGWILVKERLNAGEQRRLFSGVIRSMALGEKIELDPEKVGLQKVLVYLIDWSASEDHPIRGKSSAEIADAVNSLSPETYQEILRVIETHETEMDLEASVEKNAPDTSSSFVAI